MANTLRYTKLVATEDGGSKFEVAEMSLSEQAVSAAAMPMLVGSISTSAGVVFLRTSEFDSDPHPAPREQWVVILRAVEVEASSGERRRFESGDLLFVADTTGRGHVTRAIGQPPVEALFLRPH